ncbi:MAG: hypothetical protein AABN95_09415 [Acidobacteriota bacterium]
MNVKPFNRPQVFRFATESNASSRLCFLVLIAFSATFCLGANAVLAQHSASEFHKILRELAAFDEIDFAALEQGETVVSLLPANDTREVAVSGLVGLQAPAEVFLQSFRESMSRKTNPAILEIGRFSSTPALDDLKDLTIESRDIDDMKECVVGDCALKLSATMIERFHRELDLEAPDYRTRAAELLKLMLLEYVRDYAARGDAALIEYNDQSKGVRVAEEQRALMGASTYYKKILPEKGSPKSEISIVENAIVWSKIKFGLKPVTAINHIIVYKREQAPQVLVAEKQIYANHYFDSSLALTAFVNIPGDKPGTYLFYENRSRADGLKGAFRKIKRGIIENRAIDSLKNILDSSKANLNARTLSQSESASAPLERPGWRGWKVRRVHLLFSLLLITAFVALFTLSNYAWKGSLSGRVQP